ncbi:MAG: beta-galactosidase [Ruminococcaceae bacterium]|nr:beta-galactosidase [Oscillospiraceae bacterium]
MIYRVEHPKPQFERAGWKNLNGTWQFEIDRGNSGAARKIYDDSVRLSSEICVPFCPQSELSGIRDVDFMNSVWYKRTVELTEAEVSGKVYLHFGAVDYLATVYVNGVRCGEHKGGYVSFKVDVTDYVHAGVNTLCVHAEDDERNRLIPCGKQSYEYASRGCHYTRTTGIWQTVWMEFLPVTHIEKVKYLTDTDAGTLTVIADVCGASTLTVAASFAGKDCGRASAVSDGRQLVLTLKLTEKHLWEIGKGGLYDLTLTYGEDTVKSYFGLRSIDYRDYKFFLNGKSVFQRLILDQGFYPDGIYTAPSDAELEADIDRSVAMGFNGARLHEKVFEERFLYHADRKGYLVWGEFPNWGLDHSYADSIYGILPEWLEEVERDFNHPAIVGWCPFNETWDQNGRKQYDDALAVVYYATKAADPTRPCIDTSGNFHVVTDIYDVHDYEQDPAKFAETHASLATDGTYRDRFGNRQNYDGKLPFFVSEYGGIQWTDKGGWGYGNAPKTEEEFLARLKGLTDVLLDNPRIFAYCYTQLTDVEQEQNGLYTYDRKPKFDPAIIHAIFSKKAAVED